MNLKRSIATLLLLTSTPACMTTRRVAPAQYLTENRPAQMVVLDDGGSVHVLQAPAIVGENLVGIEVGTPDTLSLPVSQVEQAMVKQKSPARTALLVGGLTLGAALAVMAVAGGGSARGCEAKSSNPLVVLCPDSAGRVYDDT
ncbi:MAG: hypothetical protein HY560_02785 [Gemmatimonadetes bacterium]|nr:hypothetical protein [Gemmatimonadota bacterium]